MSTTLREAGEESLSETKLSEELSHVEKVAADAAAHKLHGHEDRKQNKSAWRPFSEELASAAEAVRAVAH